MRSGFNRQYIAVQLQKSGKGVTEYHLKAVPAPVQGAELWRASYHASSDLHGASFPAADSPAAHAWLDHAKWQTGI